MISQVTGSTSLFFVHQNIIHCKLLKIRYHAAKNKVSKREPILLPLQILTRKVGVNASKYPEKERKINNSLTN